MADRRGKRGRRDRRSDVDDQAAARERVEGEMGGSGRATPRARLRVVSGASMSRFQVRQRSREDGEILDDESWGTGWRERAKSHKGQPTAGEGKSDWVGAMQVAACPVGGQVTTGAAGYLEVQGTCANNLQVRLSFAAHSRIGLHPFLGANGGTCWGRTAAGLLGEQGNPSNLRHLSKTTTI